jgi:hypothetical protein
MRYRVSRILWLDWSCERDVPGKKFFDAMDGVVGNVRIEII